MPAEVIDTLELNIKTKANLAKDKLDKLATSIETFGGKVSQYAHDMQTFGDALAKIADAAKELSQVKNFGKIIKEASKVNTGMARTKAAAKVAKESRVAWKQYDDWNREYKQSHRLNWKEVKRNQDLYAKRNMSPDYTDQEIAAWKAEEDAKDEAQRVAIAYGQAKQYTEELVRALSVGKTDTKQIVEDVTGISREAKSAAASMGDFLLAEESAASKSGYLPADGPWGVGKTSKSFNPATGAYEDVLPKNGTADTANDIERVGEAARWARAQIAQLVDALNFPPQNTNWADSIDRMLGIGAEVKSAEDSMSAFMQAMQADSSTAANVRELNPELQNFCQEAMNAGNEATGLTSNLADLDGELKKKKSDAKGATEGIRGFKGVMDALRKTINGTKLSELSNQLFRVAKMRALRAVVKSVGAGFKEGLSNLYGWSNKAGGHFAGAMDTIASKAMLAKNSIATAFAPAIEALVPVISTVVGWINSLSNAFAQLISLLTGKNTWTKALETSEKWGDATKKAGSGAKTAAKEMKDLLADWDELNIIQSESGSGSGGGGGGGGSATDYSKMFQEMTAFDEWTRYFDQIKQIVIAIGAGIAGWHLIDIGAEFLKNIGFASATVDSIASRLRRGLEGTVMLAVSLSLAEATGKSVARNGFTVTNVLTGIGSLLSGAMGGYFLGSAINPSLGVIGAIAGLTMPVIVGLKAYIDEKRTMLYEQVDEYLQEAVMNKVFDFDVDAVVEKVNTTIANADAARRDVQDQLSDVLSTVDVLKLGVNEKDTWNELYNQVIGSGENSLIGKLQTQLSQEKNVITVYYQTKSKEGLEGKGSGAGAASGMKTELMANTWLTNQYTTLGKKFANCFVEGEVATIKEGQADVAMAILESITNAELAAEKARNEAQLTVDMKNRFKNLDDDVVMAEMATVFEEYEQKIADSRRKIAEEHYITLEGVLAQLKELGADKSLIASVEEQVRLAKEELEKDEFAIKVHAEFADDEKKMFGEELVKRYGKELGDLVEAIAGKSLDDGNFKNLVMEKGGFEAFVKSLEDDFMSALPPETKKFMKENGYSVLDFFTGEQKTAVNNARSRFYSGNGDEPDIVEEEIEKIEPVVSDIKEAVEENAAVPEGLEKAADRINSEIGTMLKEAVITAAEKSGMSVEDYIASMNAGDIWPLLESIKEILDKSNLTDSEQETLDANGWLTTDLMNDSIGQIYEMLQDKYGDRTSNAEWFNPEQGMTVDAAASGMALDSTVGAASTEISGSVDALGILMQAMNGILGRIEDSSRATANKDFTVVINPSSLFGDVVGRSQRAYEAANG